jgi:phosphonoacetaldehyde hydrolase
MEGRHAGCWTVAAVASGNEVGLTAQEWQELPDQQKKVRRELAQRRLAAAQPDYCVDTVAELPQVLAVIERRLAAGGRPGTTAPQSGPTTP